MKLSISIWISAFALVACSSGGGGARDPESPDAEEDAFGLTERIVVEGLNFPTDNAQPSPMETVDSFPSLWFPSPVALTHAGDGSDRLFVAQRDGRVRVFDNDAGASSAGTYLDLSARVFTSGEAGLLGIAFDPDYADNGFVYVRYETTTSTPGMSHRSIVSRFEVDDTDPDRADPSSEVELLAWDNPYSNHNGGDLAFGPDDMLYISSGDGGSQNDPDEAGGADIAQGLLVTQVQFGDLAVGGYGLHTLARPFADKLHSLVLR